MLFSIYVRDAASCSNEYIIIIIRDHSDTRCLVTESYCISK